jgi:hypothetical protein
VFGTMGVLWVPYDVRLAKWMCANGDERKINKSLCLQFFELYTIYISKSNVIKNASYIKCFDKESYMWISGFFHMGKQRKQMLFS